MSIKCGDSKMLEVDEATETTKTLEVDRSSDVMISVKCGDGKTLKVDEATAFMSELIKTDIMRARRVDEATAFTSELSKKCELIKSSELLKSPAMIMRARIQHKDWPNVVLKLRVDPMLCWIPSDLLEKAFDYCKAHANANADDDLDAFDKQFLHGADPQLLINLSRVAVVLDIEGLYELASRRMTEVKMDEFISYVVEPGANGAIDVHMLVATTRQPLEEDTIQEECRLDAVGWLESASALLHGFEILSQVLLSIKLPNQHRVEERAATFLPEVEPLNDGYIAETK